MTHAYRRIFKSRLTGTETLRELIQTVFLAEVMATGREVWIVSPWISDIPVIDNRAGDFDALNPEWGRRAIRLDELLVALMGRGAKVTVVTRPLEHNVTFVEALKRLIAQHDVGEMARILLREELHTKGILLTGSLVLGSMNLTFGGLEMNDEFIELFLSKDDVARTRLEFNERYGT